jgi:hypothetical protein
MLLSAATLSLLESLKTSMEYIYQQLGKHFVNQMMFSQFYFIYWLVVILFYSILNRPPTKHVNFFFVWSVDLNSLHLGETLQKKFFISFLMFIIIGKEKN